LIHPCIPCAEARGKLRPTMMKTIASLEEIRAEIRRRIVASKWANGYFGGCEAPILSRIQHDGIANWIAPVPAAAIRGCEGFVLDIVALVRQDYDLPAQSLTDTVRELLGARKSPF
jgi:hypothetical protein